MKDKFIGIIGVGLMGHGIADNIQKNGWRVGFLEHAGNQPTQDLIEGGATVFQNCAELTRACDVVIICVTGAPEVEDVLLRDDGVIAGLTEGTLILDCSTSLPGSSKKFAQQIERAGGQFMDAPMTRTPREAAEGRLNLIVGGDQALFDQVLPLLQAFAENITYAGSVGAGHSLKLLHNFVSLGFSAVVAEAAAASHKAGVAPDIFYEVLAKGGGQSAVLERMAPFLLNQDGGGFRFSLANGAKDTSYYLSMVEDLSASRDVASLVRDFYKVQIEAGHGEHYIPELIDLLKDQPGDA